MIDFLTIVLLIFGVLQIILFFKVWGMTNNIKRIWKKIDNKDFLSDACIAYIKGNMEETEKLVNEAYLQEVLRSQTFPTYKVYFHYTIKAKINKVNYAILLNCAIHFNVLI